MTTGVGTGPEPSEVRAGRYDRPIFGDRPPAPSRSSVRGPAGAAAGEAAGPGPSGGGGSPGVSRSQAAQPAPLRGRRRLGLQGQLLLFSVMILGVVAAVVYFFLRPSEAVYVLDVYQYAVVGTRDFRDLIVTTGKVAPEEVVVSRAPSEARVAVIYASPGDDVEAGQVLMELVSDSLADNLARARAEAEAAALELEQARLKAETDVLARQQDVDAALERLRAAEEQLPLAEQLYGLGGLSAKELQAARDEVERRRREVESAEQSLRLTRQQAELSVRQAEQKARSAERQLGTLLEQLEELTVRAKTDGRVLDVAVREGQQVSGGTELLRYADVSRQHIETAVTPDQAARLHVGTSALLRTTSATIQAVVAFVAPQATAGSGGGSSVAVTLAMDPETSSSLRPYSDVVVELELGVRPQRPALPRGPFFASGDTSFVYVISEDGRSAERRDVRYGAVDGSFVEIVTGLEPGERIIYSSYTAFRTHPVIQLIPEGGRLVE